MMRAETYFAERSARANLDAFDQIMQRSSGEAPRAGDKVGH
jgi:hypothetical protein